MQRRPATDRRPFTIASLALLIVLVASASFAVPAAPDLRTFLQPDGTKFVARLWGDEWHHGWETADGYSILPDETTGYWYFARVGPTGGLQASSLRPGLDAPVGLQRGLRGLLA